MRICDLRNVAVEVGTRLHHGVVSHGRGIRKRAMYANYLDEPPKLERSAGGVGEVASTATQVVVQNDDHLVTTIPHMSLPRTPTIHQPIKSPPTQSLEKQHPMSR